jgi:hypothetical protein
MAHFLRLKRIWRLSRTVARIDSIFRDTWPDNSALVMILPSLEASPITICLRHIQPSSLVQFHSQVLVILRRLIQSLERGRVHSSTCVWLWIEAVKLANVSWL